MKKLLIKVISKIIGGLYDLPRNLSEYLQIVLLSNHQKTVKATHFSPFLNGHVAILAIYPNTDQFWNVVRVAKQLKSCGYNVLVVSNKSLSHLQLFELSPYASRVLERKNIGRDFGAYAHGLNYLAKTGIGVEKLLLLNDSLFYPAGFEKWIKIASRTSGFGGLTVNNSFVKHVQSFFVFVDRSVLENELWLKFWKNLKPLSSRLKNIRRGEYELSQQMQLAGFVLKRLVDSPMVVDTLRKSIFTKKRIKSDKKIGIAFYDGLRCTREGDLLRKEIFTFEKMLIANSNSTMLNFESHTVRAFENEYLGLAEWCVNHQNPWSTLALPLSYFLGLPLKKDLMRKWDFQPSWFMELPGYSGAELISIKAFFIKRGTSADIYTPIKRMLFNQGRIE